ncbi:type II toxin-antitoxin system RelE/ParE family toxin [Actinomyces sp. oral taxon 414]|uniref:type II toxin-antitoxin system RelE/ParE family toxin n=1 Tax=Actinomyces sp. oral taxon 414 TaxID=712122 RepID=UPI003460C9F6
MLIRKLLYNVLVIRSFADKATELVWNEQYVRSLDRRLQRAAMRKLEQLHAARCLKDLRVPPGNRLERVSGDRRGQYSIRVNAQWRICFAWRQGGAEDVELVDYH